MDVEKIADRMRLDSVRGLACLLLVINHSVAGAGVMAAQREGMLATIFEDLLTPVRMPLFSILSGFIYAMRPAELRALPTFVNKKIWRLIVPYLTTAILLILAVNIATQKDYCDIECMTTYAFIPYKHLWFLQAVFVIFMAVAAIDALTKNHRPLATTAMLAAATLGYFSDLRAIEIFSIGQAFFLAPFFIWGIAVYRSRLYIAEHYRLILPILAISASLLFAAHILYNLHDGVAARRSVIALLLGLSGCGLLLVGFPRIKLLARIGAYSFSIYLFHTAFASLANRATHDLVLLSSLSVVLGILGPIAIEYGIRRFAPFLGFLIGISRQRAQSSRAKPALSGAV